MTINIITIIMYASVRLETSLYASPVIRMTLVSDGSQLGVLTAAPGTLTNDFFLNLLTMSTVWQGLTLVHFSAQPKPFWSDLPVSPCLLDRGTRNGVTKTA